MSDSTIYNHQSNFGFGIGSIVVGHYHFEQFRVGEIGVVIYQTMTKNIGEEEPLHGVLFEQGGYVEFTKDELDIHTDIYNGKMVTEAKEYHFAMLQNCIMMSKVDISNQCLRLHSTLLKC